MLKFATKHLTAVTELKNSCFCHLAANIKYSMKDSFSIHTSGNGIHSAI